MEVIHIVSKSYIKVVEKAVAISKNNKKKHIEIANEITEALYATLSKNPQKIVGINNRIKTEQSLKEKLIRKKIYKKTKSPQEMLTYISDIIGVLIECEFVKDEENIFKTIMSDFSPYSDTLVQSNQNKKIFLDISEKQPHLLHNGTSVYKIDGIYKTKEAEYKFELQIKSMVKVFWSEVEHSIVYKNNYYIPEDIYVVQTLEAIKQNLFGLDNMLDLINTHTSTINSSNLISNLTLNERLVKQLISETFNEKLMRELMIKINIKNTRDLACRFILEENYKLSKEEQDKNFYNIIERFKELQNATISLREKTTGIDFTGDQYEKAKKCLYNLISEDFEWDLYFIILESVYHDKNLNYFIDETIRMFVKILEIEDYSDKKQNKILINCIKQGILLENEYKKQEN